MKLEPLVVSVLDTPPEIFAGNNVVPRLQHLLARYPERWFLYVAYLDIRLVVLRDGLDALNVAVTNGTGWAPLRHGDLELIAAFDHEPSRNEMQQHILHWQYPDNPNFDPA